MSKPLAFIIEDDEDTSNIFSAALQTAGFGTEAISPVINPIIHTIKIVIIQRWWAWRLRPKKCRRLRLNPMTLRLMAC